MSIRYALILTAATLLCSCGREISPAQDQLDWSTVADRQMILVTTTDPEGEPRTTRLWIVVVGESGYLRSADTPLVMDAYSEKYGLLGRTVLRFYSLIGRYSGPSDARILRLKSEPPAV
jgi:hypothetical protein